MPTIHFLNVRSGDCSIIQHYSGHVTVIDVCNANPDLAQSELETSQYFVSAALHNFNQKKYPVNPIQYLSSHGINSIFRYIQTHPDMDHMDGIRVLFKEFHPTNFWDTNNKREIDDSSWTQPSYDRADWNFYKNLRDTDPGSDPRRLTLLAGARGKYWNQGEDSSGGDGIKILAPTETLVDAANRSDDYNDCSYVLLYRTGGKRIVFGGDSHDNTWDHILKKYEDEVTDIDLLIAPHHGRDSGRSYDFLDALRPALTFFGNARSEHLAYDEWYRRDLPILTNNQANCMVVNAGETMELYVTNKTYAKSKNPNARYNASLKAWFVGPIER